MSTSADNIENARVVIGDALTLANSFGGKQGEIDQIHDDLEHASIFLSEASTEEEKSEALAAARTNVHPANAHKLVG